jgi:hypothetical protein
MEKGRSPRTSGSTHSGSTPQRSGSTRSRGRASDTRTPAVSLLTGVMHRAGVIPAVGILSVRGRFVRTRDVLFRLGRAGAVRRAEVRSDLREDDRPVGSLDGWLHAVHHRRVAAHGHDLVSSVHQGGAGLHGRAGVHGVRRALVRHGTPALRGLQRPARRLDVDRLRLALDCRRDRLPRRRRCAGGHRLYPAGAHLPLGIGGAVYGDARLPQTAERLATDQRHLADVPDHGVHAEHRERHALLGVAPQAGRAPGGGRAPAPGPASTITFPRLP